jgi:U3 small nucleolar RNA-associated protein 18
VQSVQFHPRAPVILTAGLDKTVRLFHIDGKENPKVQSFFIKDLPIFSAHFTQDGSQIILTGRRNYFYSISLETGKPIRTTGIRG